MTEIPNRKKTFRVKLGHAEVSVEGETREEAIRQARRRLSLDMPRLYDVIQRIDDNEFRVDPSH